MDYAMSGGRPAFYFFKSLATPFSPERLPLKEGERKKRKIERNL